MQSEIVIAGFGGQGVLFAGQVLAYAAMQENRQVTWIPSYGPEMRGGTANCTVVISDEEIGSPLVRHPSAAIAMNLPSLEKYEPLLAPDGILIANSDLAERPISRKDLRGLEVAAIHLAERAGDKRLLNIVLLGALLTVLPILPIPAVEKALREHVGARHKDLLDADLRALHLGMEAVA